jgi:hypothetical protein
MSDKREHQQVDTAANAKMDRKKDPVLPVLIPMSIVRWLCYSLLFMFLLIPFVAGTELNDVRECMKALFGGLILGHFASQLNAIIKK